VLPTFDLAAVTFVLSKAPVLSGSGKAKTPCERMHCEKESAPFAPADAADAAESFDEEPPCVVVVPSWATRLPPGELPQAVTSNTRTAAAAVTAATRAAIGDAGREQAAQIPRFIVSQRSQPFLC
jgi:hypothetical protein